MNKKILSQVNKLIQEDGLYDTFLDDVKIFKTSKYTPANPFIYDNWIVLVLQNKKTVKLDNTIFEYNTNNYFVSSSTIPFECETSASKDNPFISLIISMNAKTMHQIISYILDEEYKENQMSVFTDNVTTEIEDIIFRLVSILNSKEESKILGDSILRELFYRVAKGKNAYFLHKLFKKASNEAKISNVLQTIHTSYNNDLNIPSLAQKENMSVASFHTHFKNITSHTPLQYIKKIRLNKAKDFIAKENYQVNETAYKVGYESVPQFSRDFKKYFGYPPKEAKLSFDEYKIIK